MLDKSNACCFTGYRPEKFPFPTDASSAELLELKDSLKLSIRQAVLDGYHMFVSGMSRGFDLWAAEIVLKLRQELPIELLCAIPFDGQSNRWPDDWKKLYADVLMKADMVHSLSPTYTPDCYYVRNCFMVQGSSRLICWHNGTKGGTKFTVQCARRRGLDIVNLADPQLSLL